MSGGLPVASIGYIVGEGQLRLLCTLNNMVEELDDYDFKELVDKVLRTYRDAGFAARIFIRQDSDDYVDMDIKVDFEKAMQVILQNNN